MKCNSQDNTLAHRGQMIYDSSPLGASLGINGKTDEPYIEHLWLLCNYENESEMMVIWYVYSGDVGATEKNTYGPEYVALRCTWKTSRAARVIWWRTAGLLCG